MEDQNIIENLKTRLEKVILKTPLSFRKMAKEIGIDFTTLNKFKGAHGKINRITLLKINEWVTKQEEKLIV